MSKSPSETIKAGRRTVTISNPDKVLFPEDGVTKRDLVSYYAAIGPKMLPHVRGRPLTMERYPDGIAKQRVFQKNIPEYFPAWIHRAVVPKKDGTVTHVLADDAATLAYLANQAVITHHTWLSTVKHPTKPDQLIFDLDPSGTNYHDVRRAALSLRERLTGLGLVPFVKSTGSRGLHVVVPLRPALDYGEVYAVAASIAEEMVAESPKVLTLEFHKAKREGRIFIDINRNAYAQTAVAPYSVRPRRGAPVAVPLSWEEVEDRRLRPDAFSMRDALERPDHWGGMRSVARSLSQATRRLARERD